MPGRASEHGDEARADRPGTRPHSRRLLSPEQVLSPTNAAPTKQGTAQHENTVRGGAFAQTSTEKGQWPFAHRPASERPRAELRSPATRRTASHRMAAGLGGVAETGSVVPAYIWHRDPAIRNHVRTLAERIETGLAAAIEALASAGAARVPSSASYGVGLAHVTAEVWANPAWTRAKSGESDTDERAGELRQSADFAASQVLMNVAPAHQAPYRAEVIIRSAGAIVHAEVLMVIGIAGCETESGFTVACLTADSNTVEKLEDKARSHRGPSASNAVAAWTNRVIDGENTHGSRPIAEETDPVAWAERWARIMLRHARDGA